MRKNPPLDGQKPDIHTELLLSMNLACAALWQAPARGAIVWANQERRATRVHATATSTLRP
jgi:hypothetical protein